MAGTIIEIVQDDNDQLVAVHNPDAVIDSDTAADALAALMRSFSDMDLDPNAFMAAIMRVTQP